MSRFEDSPDLFGRNIGHGVCGEVTCGLCGTIHNEGRVDEDSFPDAYSILVTTFAEIEICECCFERVERAVFSQRMDILKWLQRINQKNRELLRKEHKLLVGGDS